MKILIVPILFLSFCTFIGISTLPSTINGRSSSWLGLTNSESEIIVLESAKYNSLDQLMETFRGSLVYVDIWATWCKPCILEFKNGNSGDDIFEKEKVKRIYISIDRPNYENKWIKTIKKFDLKGYHIIANRQLQQDIWRNIHGQVVRKEIPYHFLVGKKGKVALKEAPNPKQREELAKKIREVSDQE